MAAKAKRELSPKQKKVQSVFGWILNVLCILIILVALFISIFTISQAADDNNVPHLGKTYFMAVYSDSMSGTFEPGDVILATEYDGTSALEVGQVITYRRVANGQVTYVNTHRIESIYNVGVYQTKGDKEGLEVDGGLVNKDDIIAVWGGVGEDNPGKVLKGIGSVSLWLSGYDKGEDGNWIISDSAVDASGRSLRYFLCVVLPLIALFAVYAFVLIRSLVISKYAAKKVAASELSEEEKERLAKEYLASKGLDIQPQSPPEVTIGVKPIEEDVVIAPTTDTADQLKASEDAAEAAPDEVAVAAVAEPSEDEVSADAVALTVEKPEEVASVEDAVVEETAVEEKVDEETAQEATVEEKDDTLARDWLEPSADVDKAEIALEKTIEKEIAQEKPVEKKPAAKKAAPKAEAKTDKAAAKPAAKKASSTAPKAAAKPAAKKAEVKSEDVEVDKPVAKTAAKPAERKQGVPRNAAKPAAKTAAKPAAKTPQKKSTPKA